MKELFPDPVFPINTIAVAFSPKGLGIVPENIRSDCRILQGKGERILTFNAVHGACKFSRVVTTVALVAISAI
jgi:hypothetical protein